MKYIRCTVIAVCVFVALAASCSLGSMFADVPRAEEGPYDLRGLTIEPSSNEPRSYGLPESQERALLSRAVASPSAPVAPRMVAEWERIQGALIRYPLGISLDCVKLIASELKVYVLCSSSSQSAARNAFQGAGVNMNNIEFVTATTDTYWTRDYAPWWITEGSSARSTKIVDVTYRSNGVRPNDDKVPQVLAAYFNFPNYYPLNVVAQGGNVMTDERWVAASTDRLIDENPSKTIDQIRALAKQTLGVDPYYVMADPSYPDDYIKHVDCWAKLISPTTVLVKRLPSSDADYAKYESAALDWTKRMTRDGKPYTVIRIDGNADAPYVNHVILNDRVLVPIMKGETDPADKKALDQIRAAYGPNYRVFGVLAAPNLPWLGTDSIHCRVNSIPAFNLTDPLLPFSIGTQPANVTVSAGAQASFMVGVVGGKEPYSYQWYRGNSAIAGATQSTYSFITTTSDDGARFKVICHDSSSASITSAEVTLTVSTTGTINLSLGKSTTASSSYSGKTPALTVDGDAATYWATKSLSSTTATQWLAVDLGSTYSVSKVKILWSSSNYAKTWKLQYLSGTNWLDAFSGTSSKGGWIEATFAPVYARQFRIYATSNAGSYYTVYEFELY